MTKSKAMNKNAERGYELFSKGLESGGEVCKFIILSPVIIGYGIFKGICWVIGKTASIFKV